MNNERFDHTQAWSAKMLSEYLNVQLTTVYRWEQAGLIRGTRIGNDTLRFLPDDLAAFLKGKEKAN